MSEKVIKQNTEKHTYIINCFVMQINLQDHNLFQPNKGSTLLFLFMSSLLLATF